MICSSFRESLYSLSLIHISITGGEEEYRALEQEIGSFLERIDAFQAADSKASNAVLSVFGGEQKRVSEAFSTPAEIQYVAIAGKFDNVKEVNNGCLLYTSPVFLPVKIIFLIMGSNI